MINPQRFISDYLKRPSPEISYSIILKEWKLFVCTLLVCLAGAVGYIKFSKPLYEVSINIPIQKKDFLNKGRQNSVDTSSRNKAASSAYFLEQVELLRSRQLFEKAIKNRGLQIEYFIKKPFAPVELYGTKSPFKVRLINNNIESKAELVIQDVDSQKFKLTAGDNTRIYNYTDTIVEPGYSITVSRSAEPANVKTPIVVQISDLNSITQQFTSTVTMRLAPNDSGTVIMSLQDKIPQRGKDLFLEVNKLYSRTNNNVQPGRAAIAFINKQLDSLNRELLAYKSKIELYAKSIPIKPPVKNAASRQTGNKSELEKQFAILQTIASYIDVPENQFSIIPNTFDIADKDLLILINRLNEAQISRQELLANEDENFNQLKQVNERIDILKESSIHEIFNERRRIFRLLNHVVPAHAKTLQLPVSASANVALNQLRTEQQAKVKLYFYLMEKRENIKALLPTKISAVKPKISVVPVPENKALLIIAALAAGFILPFIYLYFRKGD